MELIALCLLGVTSLVSGYIVYHPFAPKLKAPSKVS